MLLETIIYGRGGQGGVTAGNILVLAAMYENLYGQSFPFFGAERRGAPVTAFVRISDKPILRHGMFSEADILIVLDSRLLDIGVVKNIRVRDKGFVIVNYPPEKDLKRDKLNLAGESSIYVVDATRIAMENKLVVAGWPVVNTCILGAFSKATGVIKIDNVIKAIKEYFGGKIGEINAKAAREAYDKTVRIEV
ncbi:MAG: 2-oxoacid:acceptor oxidoreductase family protein [Desulfurococcaceae archaeon]|uniref:pyruvate synthase n=1 Tax=Staphylothermus marinus TaxID=2280 RepID=A0A7C4JLE8_STAMA